MPDLVVRSKGDQALFGGHTTQDMKRKLGVNDNRPLADFLPTLTIAAKSLTPRQHQSRNSKQFKYIRYIK